MNSNVSPKVRRSKNASKAISLSQDVEFRNYELDPLMKSHMIKEAFLMFDTDKSGEIDPKEFKKLVISLGIEIDERKINALYREIDTNRSGTIDLQEFTQMMMKYQFGKDSPIELHLENTFSLYDKNGDGYIDKDDLKKVGEELEDQMSFDDIELLMRIIKTISEKDKIDNYKDSERISKEEFINALCNFKFLNEVKKDPISKVKTQENKEEAKSGGDNKSQVSGVTSSQRPGNSSLRSSSRQKISRSLSKSGKSDLSESKSIASNKDQKLI
jgi:Ca2+-binding EF-hand superfamily protein